MIDNLFKPNVSAKGLAWNTTVKAFVVLVSMLIEVYFTRFLLVNLGEGLYGVIQITANVVMFASILTYVIQSALGRFLTIHIHQNNRIAAQKVFNVAFTSLAMLSVCVLLPVFFGISWFSTELFKVPETASRTSVQVLFSTALLSFLIISIGSICSIGTFVYNRIDLIDMLNLLRLAASRIIAILLISLAGFELYGVSVGLLVSSIVGFFGGLLIWKKLTPELSVSRKLWDSEVFHQMKGFTGWLILRHGGARALIYLDLIVVNRLYGAYETGLYGIAFFFSSKFRTVSGMFATLFNPIIIERYSKNDIDGMIRIVTSGMRLLGIFFALPVGLLCGLYRPIFSLWVGSKYESLCWLAIVLTFHLGINTSCYPLSSVVTAMDKVKLPGILTIISAVLNLALAVMLGWPGLGIGMIGVAIAGAISLTADTAVFMPYYVARILHKPCSVFFKPFVPGLIGFVIVFVFSYCSTYLHVSYSYLGLIGIIAILSIAFAMFAWLVLIIPAERKWLTSLLTARFKKQ